MFLFLIICSKEEQLKHCVRHIQTPFLPRLNFSAVPYFFQFRYIPMHVNAQKFEQGLYLSVGWITTVSSTPDSTVKGSMGLFVEPRGNLSHPMPIFLSSLKNPGSGTRIRWAGAR